MADCERLEGCAFFVKIRSLPKTAEQLMTNYCRGDNSGCARLWCISSGVSPPDDLFPNERDRALIILQQAGKSPAAILDPEAPRKTAR